jgi:hypothetical protein
VFIVRMRVASHGIMGFNVREVGLTHNSHINPPGQWGHLGGIRCGSRSNFPVRV